MNSESEIFLNKLRAVAHTLGTDLYGLDEFLGLESGTIKFIEDSGVVPEGEIMRRISLLTGMTAAQLTTLTDDEADIEAIKPLYVLKSAEHIGDCIPMNQLSEVLQLNVKSGDLREYVGTVVTGDDMQRARIFDGDIVIVRRQAIARDNDIVIARIDGETVMRRYHREGNAMWLEAEGPVSSGKACYNEDLSLPERNVRILGKVITSIRRF